MSKRNRNDTLVNNAKSAARMGKQGKGIIDDLLSVFTDTMNLNPAGKGNYLTGGRKHMNHSYKTARNLGVGGGGVTEMAESAFSWVTGAEGKRIGKRTSKRAAIRNQRMKTGWKMGGGKKGFEDAEGFRLNKAGGKRMRSYGKSYNQLLGEADPSGSEKKFMAKQEKALRKAGSMDMGKWNSQRFARAATRSTAVAAGFAAADFLNPFSMGWND